MKNSQHRLLCIVCPQGCDIEVAEAGGELSFAPGVCRRGRDYARQELRDPCRVLTSTVRLEGASLAMLPVRTAAPIPKGKLEAAMAQLAQITVRAPVRAGEVICDDLAGTSVGLIATRTVND